MLTNKVQEDFNNINSNLVGDIRKQTKSILNKHKKNKIEYDNYRIRTKNEKIDNTIKNKYFETNDQRKYRLSLIKKEERIKNLEIKEKNEEKKDDKELYERDRFI